MNLPPTTRLPNHPTTRPLDHPTIRPPDHSTTRPPDHSTITALVPAAGRVGHSRRRVGRLRAGAAHPPEQWPDPTGLPGLANYLLDLRPYVAADVDQATMADWDPAQYHAFFLRDGRQFGLPKYHGALGVYYNKDLFDEYGVDYLEEAWTYDDYLRAMKHLARDRDGDGPINVRGSTLEAIYDRIQVHVNGWAATT